MFNNKRFINVCSMLTVSGFLLSGCTTNAPGETMGVLGGAAIGGLTGSMFGKGGGKALAVVAGAAIGGLVGGHLGAQLDANSRRNALIAQNQALSTGRPTQWYGTQRTTYGSFDPGPVYTTTQGYCREYNTTIAIGGKLEKGYGQACRQPDGSWQIVS
jgi:surface antigen